MALMPAFMGSDKYVFGIFAIITMLVLGAFYFAYTLSRKAGRAEVRDALIISLITTVFTVEYIHSAQQGIYWYNGAVHYTFMHSVMLVLAAAAVRLVRCDNPGLKIFHAVTFALLSFMVAGANFISALQGILVLTAIFVLELVFRKNKNVFLLLPGMAVYVWGMIYSITAPGNAHRQAYYEGYSKGALESVLYSFKSAFEYLDDFTGLKILVPMIMLFPVFVRLSKNKGFSFKLPGVVTALSFCLYATGFTPSWYGIGEPGLARTFCAVKITFMLLLFINEYYWTGWAASKLNEEKLSKLSKDYWLTYAAAVLVLVVSFMLSKDQAGGFVTYGAYYYVHTGEALNYYNEQMAREELISESGDTVVFEPLVWRPWFLCKKEDLSTDPAAEQNRAAANWYGKSEIYVRE